MKKKIDFIRIFRPRVIIAFRLIIIKKKMNAKHSNSHVITINFYKNVNIRFHAIFFFNIFLLFTIKKEKNKDNRNSNNNNYNNNNNNNNNENNENKRNENDKSK